VGAGEPVAAKECEYAVPNEPPGADAAEHVGPALAGVTLTVPEAGPVPCVFVARTEQEYVVPLVRPVTVIGLAVLLPVFGPGVHEAV